MVILSFGFWFGFVIPVRSVVSASSARNSPSVRHWAAVVQDKLVGELRLGRVADPFLEPPFPGMVISPLGIVPKKEPGKFWLIHNLSCPIGASVNDRIPREFCTVRYASFDKAALMVRGAGRAALMAKVDIEFAFRL